LRTGSSAVGALGTGITVAPELTVADYDTIGQHLGPEPAEGLLSEFAGANDSGLHVMTVWD
jgi:hypothetical protein